MRTKVNVRKRVFAILATTALVLTQAFTMVQPKTVSAANITVKERGGLNASGNFHYWIASDGSPMFCGDQNNHNSAGNGETGNVVDLTEANPSTGKLTEAQRKAIDYIVYYGTEAYKNGTALYGASGTTISGAQVQLGITQRAVWLIQNAGSDTFSDQPYEAAARAFVNDARAYANSGTPNKKIDGCAVAFIPNGNKQLLFFFGKRATLKLTKTSSCDPISKDNKEYSLKDAVYGVFSDADAQNKIGEIKLDENGAGELAGLDEGTYYVKELTAPKGYALDENVHEVTVSGRDDVTLDVTDAPQNDPARITVAKVDAEDGKDEAKGGASLADAEFEVKYYDGQYDENNLPAEATRTWVLKTNEKGVAKLLEESKVSGDDLYTDAFGRATLPLGTITVRETKAPKGYLLGEQKTYVRNITSDGHVESVNTFVAPSVSEQIIRGDFQFVKADEVSQKRMAGIPFKVTSKTTGESHIVVSDENGMVNTSNDWINHTTNTNANDAALNADGTVDASKLNASNGVWFFGRSGDTTSDQADKTNGALPYDTYEIEELKVDANKDHNMAKFDVQINTDKRVVNLGTVDDQPSTPEGTPEIHTTFKDNNGAKEIEAAKSVKLVDTIAYTGLTPGKKYTATITMHVVNNGVDEGELKDSDGNVVTKTVEFTPTTSDGTVDVEVEIDATKLAGKDVVAFEDVKNDNKTVVTHADINDKGQTVHVKGETPKKNGGIPQTGEAMTAFAIGGAGVLGVLGGAAALAKRRMKN